jgi:hypothetical protein
MCCTHTLRGRQVLSLATSYVAGSYWHSMAVTGSYKHTSKGHVLPLTCTWSGTLNQHILTCKRAAGTTSGPERQYLVSWGLLHI